MKDQYCERLHEYRERKRRRSMPASRNTSRLPLCGLVARALSCLAAAALAGCSASPSISVMGAFFPDWMFCVLGALLFVLAIRGVLIHVQRERLLGPPLLAFPALWLLFSLLIWLLLFNS
ncbi:YtcA family lipoprotein [Paraburkholderia unamae]|nr:YtcA family lipoprotein [Paraburkholderia unamae]